MGPLVSRHSYADTLHLQTQATIIPGAGTEDAAPPPPRPAPPPQHGREINYDACVHICVSAAGQLCSFCLVSRNYSVI